MATIPPVITNAGVWDSTKQYPYGNMVSYLSAFYANGNVDQLPSPITSLPSATPAFWVEIPINNGGGGITSITGGDNIDVNGTSAVTISLVPDVSVLTLEATASGGITTNSLSSAANSGINMTSVGGDLNLESVDDNNFNINANGGTISIINDNSLEGIAMTTDGTINIGTGLTSYPTGDIIIGSGNDSQLTIDPTTIVVVNEEQGVDGDYLAANDDGTVAWKTISPVVAGVASIASGNDNIVASVPTGAVTISLADDISLTSITATGTLTVGDIGASTGGAISLLSGTGDVGQYIGNVLSGVDLVADWIDLPFSYITGVIEDANTATWTEVPVSTGYWYSDFDIGVLLTADSIITVTIHDTDVLVASPCWIVTTNPQLQLDGSHLLRIYCASNPTDLSSANPLSLPVNFAWIVSQV